MKFQIKNVSIYADILVNIDCVCVSILEYFVINVKWEIICHKISTGMINSN
jgi:hypothetical protein